jgi:hypothetical protein
MARNKFLMIDISPLQGLSAVALMNYLGRCPKLLNFAPLGLTAVQILRTSLNQ